MAVDLIHATSPEFESAWTQLHGARPWRHALYGPVNLRFYESYFSHAFTDQSVVVAVGGAPAAGLRVTSHVVDGVLQFSLFGQPSLYVESPSAGVRARREGYAAIKEHFAGLIANGSWRWDHAEHLADGTISPFGRHLLSLGGIPAVNTTQVIDLTGDAEALFSELSKSFRWSVNWGKKNLTLRLLDRSTITPADLEAFRALHIEAAGRETRSEDTWAIQYEMVKGGEAFACMGDLDGRLVTAALFPHSPEHCYYGVSASRRELFDKPLSHVLIWQAILHAKRTGCRWFETGDIRYPYQSPPPSPKELSISTFKRGFGGETVARLRIAATGSSPAGDE